MTAGMSRAPARSRSAMASASSWAGSRPASSAARRVRHSHRAWCPGSARWPGGRAAVQQVLVVLLAGRGGLGGPDRVQHGQVVGVGEGLVAGLGGRVLLAVVVQHRGEHAERRGRRGWRGGRGGEAGSFGMNLVVPGQLGSRPRAGYRVGAFRGDGEHVGEVGVGAAGQRDVGVLAVLGAGDHRQAGVHGAALGGVIGDRVAELGFPVMRVQERPGGPPALPGPRVGVQGAADEQALSGDGVDAEQVAVGQRAAGLARLDVVVVAGADDQVAWAGPGAAGDGDRGAVADDAEGDEVVADAAVELAAQRVVGGHQQGVGAADGEGDVGFRGGVHHLLRVAAGDPGVLVVFGQHGGVAVAEPQAGRLFPGGAEPDGLGEPGVAEGVGEQRHAAAVLHGLQLAGVPGQDHLPAAGLGCSRSGRPGPGRASSRPHRPAAAAPRRPRPGRGRRGGRAGAPGTARRCTTRAPRRPGCCGPTGTR